MKKFNSLYYLILLFLYIIIPVHAQEATEGRITEHNVVSIVALSGLLLFAQFVRKSRKSISNDD
ncbi:MAG: hypothetical protein GPJ54_09555 [Candidatus Heimdallarchaeota archaeon]|nr:hypothetical protein [Candidatus Heimdallarchaeota archaeon]